MRPLLDVLLCSPGPPLGGSESAPQGAPSTARLTGHGVDTPSYEAGTFLPATPFLGGMRQRTKQLHMVSQKAKQQAASTCYTFATASHVSSSRRQNSAVPPPAVSGDARKCRIAHKSDPVHGTATGRSIIYKNFANLASISQPQTPQPRPNGRHRSAERAR